jgi:phosphoribosyl 1,2-cyclic phosphodiesterase
VRASFWGVRGSVPVADRSMLGYGGNTSCVAVRLRDGSRLVLDAGTGIRQLGVALTGVRDEIHILLTHLHLDHIMGLMFFAPLFDPESRVTVWGPPDPTAGIRRRLTRYLSAPLCPIELRELPARMRFRAVPSDSFRLGSAQIEAALVNHRGPTLGYRVTDGDAVLAYIPDHEPALGQDLDRDRCESISGLVLARNASLLIHDAQYTAEEYARTRGWGHSTVHDALAFARRAEAEHVALFHHDPAHEDARLDAIAAEAADAWSTSVGDPGGVFVARERDVLELSTVNADRVVHAPTVEPLS